jgi:hypothetical protein
VSQTCSSHVKNYKFVHNFFGYLKGLDLYSRVKLKWVLGKLNARLWTGFHLSHNGHSANFFFKL